MHSRVFGSTAKAATASKRVAHQGDDDWWHAPLNNDSLTPDQCVAEIREMVREKPELMKKRGSCGENLLHWAALLAGSRPGKQARARAVLHWIIDTQSAECLNSVYDLRDHDPSARGRGPYCGEGVLHILIIKRDEYSLDRLLSHEGISLEPRAYGTFFEAGTSSATYYGEYPVSFAASIDWLAGVERLKAYADSGKGGKGAPNFATIVGREDSWGNTSLHLAVLHAKTSMYSWLREHGKADISKRNGLGLTAVSLAAVCNDASLFDHVLRDMYITKWTFGPVTCFRLPLEQIESVIVKGLYDRFETEKTNPSAPSSVQKEYRSVLELILMQRCERLVVNPLLLELLLTKWNRFGRFVFCANCIVHIGYLGLLGLLYLLVSDAHASRNDVDTIEVVVFLVTQFFWVCMILDVIAGFRALKSKLELVSQETGDTLKPSANISDQEWRLMQSKGRWMTGKKMRREVIPVSVYDVLCWFGQLLITAHFIGYCVDRSSPATTALLSLGVVLIWMSSMSLCLAFKHFGTLVIIILRVLAKDVPSFLLFFLISTASFTQGLRLLDVPGSDTDFSTVQLGMLTMFRVLLGEKPSWTKHEGIDAMGELGWLAAVYYLLFSLSTTIVLLRLMISMFNETYGTVKRSAEEEWRLTWGQAILRGERRLRLVLPTRFHTYLSIDDPSEEGYSFVFQRVDAEKFQTEEADGVIGRLPEPPKKAGEESELVAVLRSALQAREDEVAFLKSQLLRLQGNSPRFQGAPISSVSEASPDLPGAVAQLRDAGHWS